MFEVIITLACIGALYQWRHTDFVKAILMVLSPLWGAMKLAAAAAVVGAVVAVLQAIWH
jgi:hypothetical protein